jgi:hypothetical protein
MVSSISMGSGSVAVSPPPVLGFGWLLGRSDAEVIGLESELIGLIGILFLVNLLLYVG